jgi:hypothetical protein
MFEAINPIFAQFWESFLNFLPSFFAGLLILIIGLLVAAVLKRVLLTLFSFFELDKLYSRTGLVGRTEVKLWEEILIEVLRWTVVVLFLIPTLEIWGLSKATVVLNELVLYLPNVIVAVVIGFVGLVMSNLAAKLVRQSLKTMGATSANALSVFAKATIIFFTILIVLNQLGVAQDLIRILFTGIVSMLAIAGGLAFGLGGKDLAGDILTDLRKKLK